MDFTSNSVIAYLIFAVLGLLIFVTYLKDPSHTNKKALFEKLNSEFGAKTDWFFARFSYHGLEFIVSEPMMNMARIRVTGFKQLRGSFAIYRKVFGQFQISPFLWKLTQYFEGTEADNHVIIKADRATTLQQLRSNEQVWGFLLAVASQSDVAILTFDSKKKHLDIQGLALEQVLQNPRVIFDLCAEIFSLLANEVQR